jgi:putative transposase
VKQQAQNQDLLHFLYSLDTSFCIDAQVGAIHRYDKPVIFNADQECQYTSGTFTQVLKDNDIRISMEPRGLA